MTQEKRAEERNTQYVQSLLSRVKGTEQTGSFHTGAEDMRKLKLGLQVETRKWRAEAAKLMRIQSKKQSPGVSSKAWGRSVPSGDAPVKAMASAVLSSGDSKSRYRPLIVEPRRTEDVVTHGEESRVASVPVSVLQEQRQLIRANGGRWRASLELINSAKDRGRARDRDEGIEVPSPYAKAREVTSDSRDTDRDTGTTSSSSSNEASAGSSRSYDQIPNYALLIHSCLLLSLSTYNLKVSCMLPLQDTSLAVIYYEPKHSHHHNCCHHRHRHHHHDDRHHLYLCPYYLHRHHPHHHRHHPHHHHYHYHYHPRHHHHQLTSIPYDYCSTHSPPSAER
jgi:hypothetical protein